MLAAVALAVAETDKSRPRGGARRERTVAEAVKTVAAYLGNTPAVCRASYVDPRVIDRYHAGVTIAEALRPLSSASGPDLSDARVRGGIESAVLEAPGRRGRTGCEGGLTDALPSGPASPRMCRTALGRVAVRHERHQGGHERDQGGRHGRGTPDRSQRRSAALPSRTAPTSSRHVTPTVTNPRPAEGCRGAQGRQEERVTLALSSVTPRTGAAAVQATDIPGATSTWTSRGPSCASASARAPRSASPPVMLTDGTP